MAFVLVPHLAPQYKSHLTEILARNARLPVSEVQGGDRVSPDRIYILPPNRAMRIKNGVLHLSEMGRRSDWRNPIDRFFRSLAEDQGERAVGVLLSGEGSDGTEGLQAIKENGGTTYAQDGATADHLSMPRSAAVSGYVDFILSPAAIGERLGASREESGGAGSADPLRPILELLQTAKGVEFELYKRSTLRRRIRRRMTMRRLRDPRKYLRALKADSDELELLYRDILIPVTSFFREPESFQVLKSRIYPRILKGLSPHAPIRIWVPGCSTGEEAYSHAMNLVEYLGKRAPRIPFQIFATDVNPAVIEKARLGLFSKKIRSEISPRRLRRFFVETENGYRIAPFIRERCVFAAKNLVQDPPFTNLNLISCRNLLIYLGPVLQEKALRIFQYALKPRGILMLGRSETIGDFLGRFSHLDSKKKVFFERTSASSENLDFLRSGRFLETESALKDLEPSGQERSRPEPGAFDLQGALDDILPVRYIPNGVIVNGELEILRFLGNTSSYLRPAPGKPSLNLRRMAPGGLLLALRAAIHAAKKSSCAVRSEVSAALSNDPGKRVRIEVLPIKASSLHRECFLVLFEEGGIERPDKRRAAGTRRQKESRRIIELKEDLALSGEHLKAVVEEQESTNARLKASNEELLSSNEELQSINEEFETAKEELQSTNEELVSSTEEVGRGNRILTRANNDLSNLLANVDIPIILLGQDLAIRRFTPSAERVLGLSSNRIGSSLLDAGLPLRVPNLEKLLRGVIKSGGVHELEVQDERDRWYTLFLRPYRIEKSKADRSRITGAVMALIDITERKSAEKTLLRLAAVVRDSNDAVIIRDLNDRIIAWNSGAQTMYGYTEKEALGMSFSRLVQGGRRMQARAVLRDAVKRKNLEPIEARHRTKDGRTLDVLVTVTVLRDERGRPMELATTDRDITAKKQSELELLRMHARVICAQENERRRLSRELHDGVSQILSGVKYRLESLPGRIALGACAAAKILKMGGILDRAISEVRRVSENLMPSELEDLGLEAALRTLCRDSGERAGMQVTLKTGRCPPSLAPATALALYRIAQEALNNIGKHSKATRVIMALACRGKEISMDVSDNGIGFKLGAAHRHGRRGVGLGSMHERAESVGGSMKIDSARGVGTSLRIRAPLTGWGEVPHE